MTTVNPRPSAADPGDHASPPWWRRAVVYQVYLRSFADSDGDGLGDVEGLRQRLPYLRDLGVDAVWVNPWYPSPLLDGGYDVTDYRDIDPRLGTLADAERLIADAHRRGIRVIADLVPNHTAHDHAWFRRALAAAPGSPARDRYIFRDGRGPRGSRPPNNWRSHFGGPAWTRVADGQWYLHLFDASQPDLNWAHPEVRQEFHDILRFWLDRGLDGFRVDVAHALAKDPELPDLDPGQRHDGPDDAPHPHFDRPELHDIIRGWRRVVDGYDERVLVAEACVHPNRLPDYLRPDEFHQAFNFAFLEQGWRGRKQNEVIARSVADAAAVGSTPTWVWSNHDQMRHTTRFALPAELDRGTWLADGDRGLLAEAQGHRRARAAALLLLALPGSAYVYQGEELGLPEVHDLPPAVLRDPLYRRSSGAHKGRDGCRVPLPWCAAEPSYGFTTGDPWLPQPPSFAELAVDVQTGDAASVLELYRRAIALRRELLVDDESLEPLELGHDVVAFRRGSGLVCVVNMSADPVPLPDGQVVVLASNPTTAGDGLLHPDDGAWLRPAPEVLTPPS